MRDYMTNPNMTTITWRRFAEAPTIVLDRLMPGERIAVRRRANASDTLFLIVGDGSATGIAWGATRIAKGRKAFLRDVYSRAPVALTSMGVVCARVEVE